MSSSISLNVIKLLRTKTSSKDLFWCFRLSQIGTPCRYLEGPISTLKNHDRNIGVQMDQYSYRGSSIIECWCGGFLNLFSSFPREKQESSHQYLTLTNSDQENSMTVTVTLVYSQCVFYNETTNKWNDYGCHVTESSTSTMTTCRCNHLTLFGSSVQHTPVNIHFKELEVCIFALGLKCPISCFKTMVIKHGLALTWNAQLQLVVW